MLNLIKPFIVMGSTLIGTGLGVYSMISDVKEEETKDEIIEDLAARYNELVEAINEGTLDLDSLEDVDVEDEEDETEDSVSYDAPENNDDPKINYYPGNFLEDCVGAQNRVQNLYTDIENCNDGYITFDEDALLEEVSSSIAMLCTAYQLKYIEGISTYVTLLLSKIQDIRKISNYDSSVKANKNSLVHDINVVVESADKLNKSLQLNRDEERQKAEAFEAEDEFVVPVFHKEGKVD